jgi:hypothetical protein
MASLRSLIIVTIVLALMAVPAQAKVHWHKQGASVFTDSVGQRDHNLETGALGIAELDMGTAMGGLPFGAKLRINNPRTNRTVTAYKYDIGAGGGSVFGRVRAVDLHCRTARALGIKDCSTWTGTVLWRRVR